MSKHGADEMIVLSVASRLRTRILPAERLELARRPNPKQQITKLLCLPFLIRPLLGIPQRYCGLVDELNGFDPIYPDAFTLLRLR